MKGEAKPHRTTRFVILVITVVATISLFAQHDRVAIWLIGIASVFSMVIFLLSLKYGMGGWAKKDIFCLLIALGGIVLWQTTKDPALALYASIASDLTGMVPTLIKTFRLPHTEVWTVFFLDTLAAGLNLLAVNRWVVQEFSYPLYIVLINLVMVFLVLRPKLLRKK